MKYDEFIAQVQRRADLNTKNEAVQATRAVLETLGERLAGGEPKDLAAQLPTEFASYLQQPLAGAGVPFTLDDFFMRVAEREGSELPEATFHARVVLGLVAEVVTMGEIENIRAQLPAEFRQLFEVENERGIARSGCDRYSRNVSCGNLKEDTHITEYESLLSILLN